MILLSTRMSSSGRSRPWGAWVYAENKPLQVLGLFSISNRPHFDV